MTINLENLIARTTYRDQATMTDEQHSLNEIDTKFLQMLGKE